MHQPKAYLAISRPARGGFTLTEILIAVGLVALLLGLAWPPYARYRGRSAVNNATDLFLGMADRAKETARASGYPLDDELKADGLTEPSIANATEAGADLWARIRHRRQPSAPLEVVAERPLVKHAGVDIRVLNLGLLDLEAEDTVRGVFLELLSKSPDGTVTVLATIPFDVNGELVLENNAGSAGIAFNYGNYQKAIQLTQPGVVVER